MEDLALLQVVEPQQYLIYDDFDALEVKDSVAFEDLLGVSRKEFQHQRQLCCLLVFYNNLDEVYDVGMLQLA